MARNQVALRAIVVALLATPFAVGAQARVRVGGVGVIATRNAAVGTTTGTASGMMGGVDILLRNRMMGLSVRTLDGNFDAGGGGAGSGQITNGDVRLLLGPALFSVEGGVGRRAFTDAVATRVFNYGAAGARIAIPLGGSGYEAHLGGSAYLGGKLLNDSSNVLTGFAGQTGLYYSVPRLPLYVMAGYRFERVTVSGPSRVLPEEVSGILVGAGLQRK